MAVQWQAHRLIVPTCKHPGRHDYIRMGGREHLPHLATISHGGVIICVVIAVQGVQVAGLGAGSRE